MSKSQAVKMTGISKYFGSVVANENVSLHVEKGEVHALLGENGAGKSTLMNMLSGVYAPDGGSIFIHGKQVHFRSPKDAIKNKIGMIHQHFKLIDVMTAAENIAMANKQGFFLHKKSLLKSLDDMCKRYDLYIDFNKKICDMSVGEKQTVEILKVLYMGADILILDEPTAVLTPQETKKLFDIIRHLKDDGCSILIITHKLDEVMEISNRVTVLRKGTTVHTINTHEATPAKLAELMVGKAVDLDIPHLPPQPSDEELEIKNLNVIGSDGVTYLEDINFTLKGGEILGVAGVAGSGQKQLCEAIAGLVPVASGSIQYNHQELVGLDPRAISALGIGMSFVPEDRLGMGLVASMGMVENYLLKHYHSQKGLFVSKKEAITKCEDMVGLLDIKTPDIETPVRQLSGGNIQKVLLGREIEANPHFLVTAYATRGLDIASSQLIYDLIKEEKKNGVGVLYIGEDIDVLLQLCDRVMVMCENKVIGIKEASKITKEEVGLMMAGKSVDSEVKAC